MDMQFFIAIFCCRPFIDLERVPCDQKEMVLSCKESEKCISATKSCISMKKTAYPWKKLHIHGKNCISSEINMIHKTMSQNTFGRTSLISLKTS